MLPFTLLYLSTSHRVTPALPPERALSALTELILSLGGVSYKYFWKQVVTINNRISGRLGWWDCCVSSVVEGPSWVRMFEMRLAWQRAQGVQRSLGGNEQNMSKEEQEKKQGMGLFFLSLLSSLTLHFLPQTLVLLNSKK